MPRLRPFAQFANPAPKQQVNEVALATGGMLALAAAMGIGRFVYTPILPPMVQALALTKLDAGVIAAANFLGYLCGSFAAALPRLSARRRSWFLAALAISAATTAGMAFANTIVTFCLLRFLGGVASAFALILGSAEVLEGLAASERGGLAALHFSGVGLGIAISALLIDALQMTGASWRLLWLSSGALASLAVAVGVAAGDVWPTAAGALLASLLLGGTFMGITALGFAAVRALAPDQQRRSFALMTAGFGVGQIIGPIVAGWLIDRTGSFAQPSLLAAAALTIGAAIAIYWARHLDLQRERQS